MTQEALKLALEALEFDSFYGTKKQEAITAIKEALAQTQEPDDGYCKACDGWKCTSKAGCVALDNPPQRTERPVDCKRCNRLEDALKRANGLAEHFERAWYLRGDEIERLTAQPEQEPVSNDPLPRACNLAGVDYQTFLKIKAYMPVAPPQRTWVDLTDEEKNEFATSLLLRDRSTVQVFEAIEAKLNEKNT